MARYDRYVEGNTVRYAAPVLEPEKSPRELAEERRQADRRKAARRNRERSGAFHFGHATYLAGCALVICACAFTMIRTKANITSTMRHITTLEQEITDMRAVNDARYKEIVASVDLAYVKEYATTQLGMKYADEDQIRYYSVEKSNYMDQYSDIPQ